MENCRFLGEHARISIVSEVKTTSEAPYYHRNVKILNNEFETASPLCATDADEIVFRGNKNTEGKEMTLTLTNCGDIDADGEKVERITKNERKLGVN